MSLMSLLSFDVCFTVHGPASSSTVYVIVHVSGTKVEVTKLYTLNLEISHFKSTPNVKKKLSINHKFTKLFIKLVASSLR